MQKDIASTQYRMIDFHFTGHMMIVLLVVLFSAWFIYQDVLFLSVNQAEMVLFLVISVLIRLIGYMTGFHNLSEVSEFLVLLLLISFFIGCLCLKKWMGWGDFMMILGLLMLLQTEDMIELVLFSFCFSAIVSLALLIFGYFKMKQPLPFIPFLMIGYFLAISFRWQLW